MVIPCLNISSAELVFELREPICAQKRLEPRLECALEEGLQRRCCHESTPRGYQRMESDRGSMKGNPFASAIAVRDRYSVPERSVQLTVDEEHADRVPIRGVSRQKMSALMVQTRDRQNT